MVWCGVVWGWDVWGKDDELEETIVITDGLGVPSVVRLDCGESCKCLSIEKLTAEAVILRGILSLGLGQLIQNQMNS